MSKKEHTSKDKEPKVHREHYPIGRLIGESRRLMVDRVNAILGADSFGEEEFDSFVDAMIQLRGGQGEKKSGNKGTLPHTYLQDEQNAVTFDFSLNRRGGNSLSAEDRKGSQMLWYKDHSPVLYYHAFHGVPPVEFSYHSPLTADTQSVAIYPSPLWDELPISNADVQAICRRVFSIQEQTEEK